MPRARFTTGSTMRHVAVMTATGATGLMALFLVDALNLFYISLLGVTDLAAAVGFAGTLQFFMISVAIGLSIAGTALVSRAIGADDRARARRVAASALVTLVGILTVVTIAAWIFREDALALIGAEGETLEIASRFLAITLGSTPIVGIGMVTSGFLRAAGDARRAMFVTLFGGGVAAVLDPILILGLDYGVDGAAAALVITRCMIAATGLWYAVRVHRMVGRIDLRATAEDMRALMGIAAPAVATQLSTPFGNAFLTGVVSVHGDEAVAGWAVVGRVTALCFGGIFALSGAVGPIFGQNLGARLFPRLRMIYRDALVFAFCYVILVWAALALATGALVAAFTLQGEGAEVLRAFTTVGVGGFMFTAALFVSNAAFNNLGRPQISTVFNWSRDAVATPIFAALIGSSQAAGVVWMQAAAALVVGGAAALYGWRYVARMSAAEAPAPEEPAGGGVPVPAFASGRAAFTAASLRPDSLAPEDEKD